jgi:hypothetical protein
VGCSATCEHGTYNNKQRRQQVIIKHLVELETVINEESPEPTVKKILDMPEEFRNMFFQQSGVEMIEKLLEQVNDGHSWAQLRVAQPR